MLPASIVEATTRPIEQASCLPGFVYTDPELARGEFDRVFRRSWVSIGFGYQVPTPGSVLPVRLGGEQLLMVRGGDGRLRVFHNVCRHRGAQLVAGDVAQTMSSISCPYHGWTYDLGGHCVVAPCWHRSEQKALRPSPEDDLGLIEVRSHIWLDTIFIDLSGSAPPFEQVIAPLADRWGTAGMAPLSHVTTWEREIPANWKLVIENFLDTYHSPYVHSQLGSISVHIAHRPLRLSEDIIGQRSLDAAINKPRSGAIPIIPELGRSLGADDETYCLFPNTLVFAQRSFFSVRAILPRSVGSAYEMNAIYVSPETTVEKYGSERQRMKEAIALVNEQDLGILVNLQGARGSMAVDRGRFAPEWDFMSHQFQMRIAKALQA